MARTAVKRFPAQTKPRGAGWRSLRTAAITCMALSIFCTAALGLYRYSADSDYFRVKTIRIDGAHLLKAKDIVAASGISNAENIWSVNPDTVEARVEAIPYVKQCTVTRTVPDLVRIAIEERYPVATILARSRAYEIDADMTVLRRLSRGDTGTGPLISQIPDIVSVEPGMRLTQASLRTALRIWRAFEETSMSRDVTISEISAARANEIRMYCDELPYEIRWGRDDIEKQAQNLDVLWRQRRADLPCIEYLDLRFGQDIACK